MGLNFEFTDFMNIAPVVREDGRGLICKRLFEVFPKMG